MNDGRRTLIPAAGRRAPRVGGSVLLLLLMALLWAWPSSSASAQTVESQYLRVELHATGSITVSWRNTPGNATDWVSVVPAGTPDDQYTGDWTYTNGLRAGLYVVGGLTAGDYEARLYLNWPSGGYLVADRLAFRLGGAVTERAINWGYAPTEHRGKNGQNFSYRCPPGGSAGAVWGTDVYTDDSSLCTAAVHAGLISMAGGGVVTVQIVAGQSAYQGSTRNGVTTASYGGWSGSYRFVGATPPPPAGTEIDWGYAPLEYRGQWGQRVTFWCPPGGSAGAVWGTGTYTDDSSLCTAAVHAGLISMAGGGGVTVEILAGQSAYQGSTRNGITSSSYGGWDGSYRFVGGATPLPPAGDEIDWDYAPLEHRGQWGERFTYWCVPGGSAGAVWGTDIYTDDSSLCTAAVHAGLISLAGGGTVTVEILAGQSSYQGSTRNGITTASYGGWDGSYRFVGGATPPPPPPPPPAGREINWGYAPTEHRGKNGQQFSYRCPAGGTAGSVWGTTIYTDDSSLCTAAVHAGLISLAGGGAVTIEIVAGQSAYQGSTRNGITTASYGGWGGSYRFVGATPPPPPPVGREINWGYYAVEHRGKNGEQYTYRCPAGGSPGAVWGTDVYTDDSSVCTAAVHAGLITLASGGTVTIEIVAGQSAYQGSTRNGITTSSYGGWGGSYRFVR